MKWSLITVVPKVQTKVQEKTTGDMTVTEIVNLGIEMTDGKSLDTGMIDENVQGQDHQIQGTQERLNRNPIPGDR